MLGFGWFLVVWVCIDIIPDRSNLKKSALLLAAHFMYQKMDDSCLSKPHNHLIPSTPDHIQPQVPKDLQKGSQIESANSVKWFNDIIQVFWNKILSHVVSEDMINIILDDVLVKMKEENPTGAWFVDKMTIRNLDVGNCPLVISGIKAIAENPTELTLDIGIMYPGNAEFQLGIREIVETSIISGRDVQFAMKFRIVLPLHKDMTVVGAIGVTLLDYPVLRFGPEGVLRVPIYILKILMKEFGGDVLDIMLKVPRGLKFYGPGITGEHIPTISFPTGIIRVLLLDGKDCPISDRGFKQLLGYTGGSADPYSILSVGRYSVRSPVVNNTLNPTWNFYCEFPILEGGLKDQELRISILDRDKGTDDKQIGFASLDLNDTARNGEISEISLKTGNENFRTGQIRIRVQWVPICEEPEQELYPHQEPCSKGLLCIYIKHVRTSRQIIPLVSVQLGGTNELFTTAKGDLCRFWEFEEEIHIMSPEPKYDWIKINLHNCEDKDKWNSYLGRFGRFGRSIIVEEDKVLEKFLSHKEGTSINYPIIATLSFPVRDFYTEQRSEEEEDGKTLKTINMKSNEPINAELRYMGQLHFIPQPKYPICI
ncbi:extended synaptotagmin-1 isoform X5 [Eurytemora carolleeae]|nr:extended synaptotagmin-1 isoform X1 [Eurytemora carolleeae]XP_023328267.1 extended synaptotagmin-1 isoform X3 [Eurytemora carolleeae]XP_023328268.1 extended synaptotagmin-1 isoform X4 [Eurytemora carolleeae]XP_023328269.1 extended synaptotagmin-1 isoform X5 [Eurytemora carolleeae]|eukprot:XP_023328264.1 extended synaptotagmin-1-like isoform X1 [Eurytemora affinis]